MNPPPIPPHSEFSGIGVRHRNAITPDRLNLSSVGRRDPPPIPARSEPPESKDKQRELDEMKARVTQMEKTLRWWSECTCEWRKKWAKVKEERNEARSEVKLFRTEIDRLKSEQSRAIQQQHIRNMTNSLKDELLLSNGNHILAASITSTSNVDNGLLDKESNLSIQEREQNIKETNDNKRLQIEKINDLKNQLSLDECDNDVFEQLQKDNSTFNLNSTIVEQCGQSVQNSVDIQFNRPKDEKIFLDELQNIKISQHECTKVHQNSKREYINCSTVDQQNSNLQEENINLRMKNKKLEEEIINLQDLNKISENQILNLKVELDKMKENMCDKISDEKLNELTETRNMLVRLKKAFLDKTAEIDEMKTKNLQFNNENLMLNNRVDQLKKQLTNIEYQLDVEIGERKKLQRSNDDLVQQNSNQNKQIQHLQSKLRRVSNSCSGVASSLQNAHDIPSDDGSIDCYNDVD